MRDFIYIYFEMVKQIQKYFTVLDVRIVLRETGDVTIYTYSNNEWNVLTGFDTLSEFITWIEFLQKENK